MNDLLIGLCSYLAIQSTQGNTACRTTVGQAYNISALKPIVNTESKQLEKEGLALYQSLPGRTSLGAMSFLSYEVYKKDFKVPLTNSINLEYNNFNIYSCNLKWSW
jgi:hypothetical protein